MSYVRLIRDLEYQELPKEFATNQFICKNVCPMGHSVFKVILPKNVSTDEHFIQLPQKWKRKVMFGRNDYCIATFPENFLTFKSEEVVGNIDLLLTKINVKELLKTGKLLEFGFVNDIVEELEQIEQGEEHAEFGEEVFEESSASYY
ncbi:Conserved_hypothetical protein [Hexamita inflata]|uniref:Uncharacterized protein n=1 Tax=Hexamita inflata TaxID=28002 RepID=A0ABP1ISV1_9EUKA